jgi:uncharacterized membrane protein YgdD (TMEM256/DUF423 family)
MKGGHWIMIAGILAFLGVALGAFGAHALSSRFGDYEKGVWHTATEYHLVHALALFGFGIAAAAIGVPPGTSPALWNAIGWLFTVGIVLFSGSLYVLALTGVKVLGAITPFGGLSFMAAWVLIARAGYFLARSGIGPGK